MVAAKVQAATLVNRFPSIVLSSLDHAKHELSMMSEGHAKTGTAR
jgi:hypothetical protein